MFFLIEESENCWQLISLKLMSASVSGVCGKKIDFCGNHEIVMLK